MVKKSKKSRPNAGVLKISLTDPGMTAIHRIGLAGLWMSLDAFDRDQQIQEKLAGLGRWEKDASSVTLYWNNESFFRELLACSFKIDQNGFFYFPALGTPQQHIEYSVVLQEAILNSILQHGRTRKADSATKPSGNISIEIDNHTTTWRYRRIQKYAHQYQKFCPSGHNKLVGWLFPGGTSRHIAFGNKTDLEAPPGLALALRYLVIGGIYFKIKRLGSGIVPRYALVIPLIKNLDAYAKVRKYLLPKGVTQLLASGTAEAGLRVLTELRTREIAIDMKLTSCQIFSFGTVPWSKQQKTRVEILNICITSKSEDLLRPFKLTQQVFQVQKIERSNDEPFWRLPQMPELVARNTIAGVPWWLGFTDFISTKECRDQVFKYEKGGLAQMVQDHQVFPNGPELKFVEACHEALRRRWGQLSTRASQEHIDFATLSNREFERLRMTFSRCKNAATIRAAVTDFWARAGSSLPPLQEAWREVMQLFSEANWQKARDLALLALASYSGTSSKGKEGDDND